MFLKIAVVIVVLIVLFVIFVATRSPEFKLERSVFIKATPERLFPYLAQIQLVSQWSPFLKMDPEMKVTYGGNEGQPGNYQDFVSKKAGEGRLQVNSVDPNKSVDLTLLMRKPFEASNHVVYSVKPEGEGSRVTWLMEGQKNFFMKGVYVFVDMDKMLGSQFQEGLDSLKTLMEKP